MQEISEYSARKAHGGQLVHFIGYVMWKQKVKVFYPDIKNDSEDAATLCEIGPGFYFIFPFGKIGTWSCSSPTGFISQDSSNRFPHFCHA